MPGLLNIAYKLLVNDRAKYAALLVGITFAVFLMIEMTSLFAGILSRSSATVINIGASIWVMDPAIQTVANTIPLPDYVLDEVRSIPGVKYAVPLYSGAALLKLRSGTYQSVSILGSGRHQPVRPADARRRQHRGHIRRERLHRGEGLRVLQARESAGRHRIRAERPSRRHRRHRPRGLQRAVRRTDALHHLQPCPAIPAEHALHDFLSAGGTQDPRRRRPHQTTGRGRRLPRPDQG